MPILVPPDWESLGGLQKIAQVVTKSPLVALYIGPDQIMPLASVLSAIAGVALMFWRRIIGFVSMCLNVFRRRPPTPQGESSVEDRV